MFISYNIDVIPYVIVALLQPSSKKIAPSG